MHRLLHLLRKSRGWHAPCGRPKLLHAVRRPLGLCMLLHGRELLVVRPCMHHVVVVLLLLLGRSGERWAWQHASSTRPCRSLLLLVRCKHSWRHLAVHGLALTPPSPRWLEHQLLLRQLHAQAASWRRDGSGRAGAAAMAARDRLLNQLSVAQSV